ncbi:MAG: M81 family metallopeptidase [Gemmobacter sp.]
MTTLFTFSLATETNTFSPIPTTAADFAATSFPPGTGSSHPPTLFTEALHVWRARAAAAGWSVTESLAASAEPFGPTLSAVWNDLRDAVLADCAAAGGPDVILAQMHGAMIAQDCDDCEGAMMAALRAAVPDAVIGLLLDPHCHLTEAMMTACDLIVTFHEYPHTDATARAGHLFDMARAMRDGRIRPAMRDVDCRMINLFRTPHPPMRAFVEAMKDAEGRDGILSLSLVHGFPWADVPRVGARMLAIADDARNDLALAAATRLARRLWADRAAICPPPAAMHEAVARAGSARQGPVVLADMADNAGGGAPGDSTFLLAEIIRAGLASVATGIFYDPAVVRLAEAVGPGTRLAIRLGGKTGPSSGMPLDLTVTVRAIRQGLTHRLGGGEMPLGTVAWLETDGIDIVVNDLRTQVFDPAPFVALGIDLTQRRVICVKSTNHFVAGFAPIAAEIIFVATPGAITPDFAAIPYRNRRDNWWPLRADPFEMDV